MKIYILWIAENLAYFLVSFSVFLNSSQCDGFLHEPFLSRTVCVNAESLLSAYWQSSTLCALVGV